MCIYISKLYSQIASHSTPKHSCHLNWYEDPFFQGIHIEHSGLLLVDVEAFGGLTSLGYLKLNDGQLMNPPSLQYMLKTLTRLELKYNRIARINAAYFAGCQKLRAVNLNGNLLSIPPNIDHIAHSLITIFLSRNRLSGVFEYFTKSFWKLQVLRLEHNQITSFCMTLGVLNLTRNNITHLNIKVQLELRKNLILILKDNPIGCENMIEWQGSCTLADDKNKCVIHDGKVTLYSNECLNITGRSDKYRYFFY